MTLHPPLPKSAAALPAREKLLDAAAIVFGRDGLSAATTREIAQAAGVNEVTLFRLFQTKQNLLASVLERVFAYSPDAPSSTAPGASLLQMVRDYAESYAGRLQKNFALMRVLLGEIQHFQEHERKVIRGIFKPERQRLIENLRAAQTRGLVRKEIDPFIVADQLGALVFMGVFRESAQTPVEYGAEGYMAACVETIVRGIEASPGDASRLKPKKGEKPA